MKLTSPDAVLIEVADRLIAIPQERGVPLPLVTLSLPFLEAAGYGLASAGFAATASWIHTIPGALDTALSSGIIAAVFGVVGAALIRSASEKARKARREAEAWSPEAASRHRTSALRNRETHGQERAVCLMLSILMIAVFALMFRIPMDGSVPPSFPLTFAGLIIGCVGRTAMGYAECAYPRDPNRRHPARMAASAG